MRAHALGGALAEEARACAIRALERAGGACARASDVDALVGCVRDETNAMNDAIEVIVVETAEGDEPANEASRTVREILRAARVTARGGVGDAARGKRYAMVMVGDCDVIAARGAFLHNQSIPLDANAVGASVDAALRKIGWMRIGPAMVIDRSKEEDEAWSRGECARMRTWADTVVARTRASST